MNSQFRFTNIEQVQQEIGGLKKYFQNPIPNSSSKEARHIIGRCRSDLKRSDFKSNDEWVAAVCLKCLELLDSFKPVTGGPCKTCGKNFEYFQTLPTGEAVYGEVIYCHECESAERRRIASEQSEKQFKKENPGAKFYLRQSGNPPCPEQYAAVVGFDVFPEAGKNSLVLVGDSYRGKTTALYHLCHRLAVQEGCDVKIVDHTELNDIPELVRKSAIRDFMDELKTVEVLALDDLDKTNITPRVASEFWGLIEARRMNELSTFITMNVRTKRDFIKLFTKRTEDDSRQIGLSIYNRLTEGFDFVDFDA